MEDLKDRTKKPYLRPEVYRVRLDPEQAVLGTCSTFNVSAADSDLGGGCKDSGCKAATHGGADSGPTS